MKIINTRAALLGLALLGATTLVGTGSPASAAPRRDVKQARKDVKEAKREVREERKDLRQADTPRERNEARRELGNAKGDLQREKRDLRNERQDNRRPGYQTPNRPGYQTPNRPGYQTPNRPGYQSPNRPGYQTPNRPGYQGRSYTGTVTNVRSNQSFDVNVGGKTFNIYTTSRLPRGLTRGDLVQVRGTQQFNNDIRNASVSIVRNR
jgi:hypothetical protein